MNKKETVAIRPPVDEVVIPSEILDLVRFLAKVWRDDSDLIHKAFALPPDKVKDFLIDNYAVIQGTANQMKLTKISEQPYDMKKIPQAVRWLLEV